MPSHAGAGCLAFVSVSSAAFDRATHAPQTWTNSSSHTSERRRAQNSSYDSVGCRTATDAGTLSVHPVTFRSSSESVSSR